MKLTWRSELPQLAVIAAMFIAAAWAWGKLPDRLPTHWNLHGQVDGYGGKFAGLLLMPMVAGGMYLLILVLPLIDPGKKNYANFAGTFNVIRLALLLFFAGMFVVMLLIDFGNHVDMTTYICLATGLLFIVLGNFMSKLRPNWFVGVRTPWTLSSKLSWNKTHRLAGWLFVAMGVLLAIAGIVSTGWFFIAILTFDVTCLAWIMVYSYLVYRDDPDRTLPANGGKPVET
jgi:uncharacterized membrane protein